MGNGIQAYLYSLDKVEAGDMPYEIDGAAATPVRGALRQQLVERIARAFPFLAALKRSFISARSLVEESAKC